MLRGISNGQQNEETDPSLKKVVQWKPIFFFLGKNKEGYESFNHLNKHLQGLADGRNRISVSKIAAMGLQHLVLAKTKDSNDGLKAKTISLRISPWKRADIETFLNKTRALQSSLPKISNKIDNRARRSSSTG